MKVSLPIMCIFVVEPQLLNLSTRTWYDLTISPTIRFLIASTIISPLSVYHITIIYWLPLFGWTGNLPVWFEYIVSNSWSRRSLTLMGMSLCLFFGRFPVSLYPLSSGYTSLTFVDLNHEVVFRICPFCLSSYCRKFLFGVFSVRPGHDV